MSFATSRSRTEKQPAFDLVWSFSVEADPAGKGASLAKLHYQVSAKEELYISDRLWDLDAKNKRIDDPFGVYRFVHGQTLRLFFGQAPWPEQISFRNVYTPFFSRVAAGGQRLREVTITVPVDEYSALARNVQAPTVEERVSRVTLVLDYQLRSALKDDPRPPPKESEAVGYIVHGPRRLVSTLEVEPLAVKRRKDPISRITLPGDP